VRMMECAENCARDIARYTHRTRAPEPFKTEEADDAEQEIEPPRVPLNVPVDDKVAEAFRPHRKIRGRSLTF